MGHDDETSYAMNASQSCGIAFKHFACTDKSLPAGSVYVECKWSHNCSFVMLRSASYEQLQRLRASGTPVADTWAILSSSPVGKKLSIWIVASAES